MNKTVNELARETLEWFETGTRDNGEEFVKTKEGRPEWLTNLNFTAHGGMMPDDHRYKFIEDALIIIANSDQETELDCPEIEADTYTSDLTKWLHSRNDRVYYLTNDKGLPDISSVMPGKQRTQKNECTKGGTN
jgi:hypothetical protein